MVLVGVHLAYANVLQWAHNEVQGQMEVKSAVLGPVGSNRFLWYPVLNGCVILLVVVPFPLPSCLTTAQPSALLISDSFFWNEFSCLYS